MGLVLSQQVVLGRAMAGEMKIRIIADLRVRPVINLATAMAAAVRLAKEKMDQKNVYFTNPAFDK